MRDSITQAQHCIHDKLSQRHLFLPHTCDGRPARPEFHQTRLGTTICEQCQHVRPFLLADPPTNQTGRLVVLTWQCFGALRVFLDRFLLASAHSPVPSTHTHRPSILWLHHVVSTAKIRCFRFNFSNLNGISWFVENLQNSQIHHKTLDSEKSINFHWGCPSKKKTMEEVQNWCLSVPNTKPECGRLQQIIHAFVKLANGTLQKICAPWAEEIFWPHHRKVFHSAIFLLCGVKVQFTPFVTSAKLGQTVWLHDCSQRTSKFGSEALESGRTRKGTLSHVPHMNPATWTLKIAADAPISPAVFATAEQFQQRKDKLCISDKSTR